jgi:hypothetical protein
MTNITKDITYIYTVMMGYRPNTLTLVVTGHFLIEYLLDKIIDTKCKDSEKFRNYTFSIKLDILNAFNLIPDEVYKNINTINKIRNKLVHTLKVDTPVRNFYTQKNKSITITRKGKPVTENFFIKTLTHGTLVQLRNHMLMTLEISPEYQGEL